MVMNQLVGMDSALLGGMCPDQTYNFATHGKASWLTLNVPPKTHPIAAAHKISSGHAINNTMNGSDSVGLLPTTSYLGITDVLGGMRPDQTYNFATHVQASRLTLNLPSNTPH